MIENTNNSDGFMMPETKYVETDEAILRHIVEFENTKLKETTLKGQIYNINDEKNILASDRERNILNRRLKDIQDRYRLNPFVIERNNEFFAKYKQFGGKIELNNFKEDKLTKINVLPKLSINIPKTAKIDIPQDINIIEEKPVSQIAAINELVKQEMSNKSNVTITAGIKRSPVSARKKYINKEYTGEMPDNLSAIFRTLLPTDYKMYPEPIVKKHKGFDFNGWRAEQEKKKFRVLTQTEITPQAVDFTRQNYIVNQKPKEDKKFKSFYKMIKPFFTETDTSSNTSTNMQRFMKSRSLDLPMRQNLVRVVR